MIEATVSGDAELTEAAEQEKMECNKVMLQCLEEVRINIIFAFFRFSEFGIKIVRTI